MCLSDPEERVRRQLVAVAAVVDVPADTAAGVALGVQWTCTGVDVIRPGPATVRRWAAVPDVFAEYDWQRDHWWPDTDGGRLLARLFAADSASLTHL